MDTHTSYLPMTTDVHRIQSQNQLHQSQYHNQPTIPSFGGRPIMESGPAYPTHPSHRIAVPSHNPPSYPTSTSQSLSSGHPREQAQYAASSASSGGSSAPSPPGVTTTLGGFERRTRRRRSFRGAATKLARRKSSSAGTKVAPIPEDPSASTPTSGIDSASAPERVSLRSYQYRAFHQADIGAGVPSGNEYSSYHSPPPTAAASSSQNEYTFTPAAVDSVSSNGNLPSSVPSSTSGNAPPPTEPPTRKSKTLTALALGKRAVREVLGGGGNNPSSAPVKVTYFGRGGAGTRRSGQLPTIRADSFGTRKNPTYGLPTPALSTSSAYAPSVVGSSGYAPSVASAPYTSTQSYGGSSPILSHRSLSPNMFAGSRLSLSSYSGTLATSMYEDEGPEGWYDPYIGHDQESRILKSTSDVRVGGYAPTHAELREEAEEYEQPPTEDSGTPEMDIPVSYTGPGGEVYIIDSDTYSNYPPQYSEKSLSPPAQPLYQDYRSSSTTTSSSNESTPMVQPNDGIPLQRTPPSKAMQYSTMTNSLNHPPAQNVTSSPLKPPLVNEVHFQPTVPTPYLNGSSNSSMGSIVMGNQGNTAPILPAGQLDLNSALQLQSLYATLASMGSNGMSQLYPQQQQLLQANVAMLNGVAANGGMLGHADLSTALAQLSLLTQPMMLSRPNGGQTMPNLDRVQDSASPPLLYPPVSSRPLPTSPPGSAGLLIPSRPSHIDFQSHGTAHYLSQAELEIAQTVARKQELEKKLQELEYQRLQREQALAVSSFDNMGTLPTQRYYSE